VSSASIPHQARFSAYIATFFLSILALLGHYLHVELFFGVDFLFGGIIVFLAIALFGAWSGLVVGSISSFYTFAAWGHPYAMVIFIAEAGIVGWLTRKKHWGLVWSDVVYWIFIGIPLVCYFYHFRVQVPLHSAWLIALKQSINGLFCAFVVSLLLALPFVQRRFSNIQTWSRRTTRQIFSELMVAFAFFAMLSMTIYNSRVARLEIEQTVYTQLDSIGHNMLVEMESSIPTNTKNSANLTATIENLLSKKEYPIDLSIFLESKTGPEIGAEYHSSSNRFNPALPSKVQMVRDHLEQYFPVEDLPTMTRWRKSFYVWRGEPADSKSWSARLATPTAPYIDQLEKLYSGYLLFQFVATGVALLCASLIAAGLHRPLEALRQKLRDPNTVWDVAADASVVVSEFDEIGVLIGQLFNDINARLATNDADQAHLQSQIDQLNQDVDYHATEKRTVESKLIEMRQRLSLVTQYAPIAIIEWQPDERISAWNPAAEKLFGYKASEVIGQDLFKMLLPESGYDTMRNTIQDLMDMTGGLFSNHQNVTQGGRLITCEWFSRPLVTAGGRIIGFVSIVVEAADN